MIILTLVSRVMGNVGIRYFRDMEGYVHIQKLNDVNVWTFMNFMNFCSLE